VYVGVIVTGNVNGSPAEVDPGRWTPTLLTPTCPRYRGNSTLFGQVTGLQKLIDACAGITEDSTRLECYDLTVSQYMTVSTEPTTGVGARVVSDVLNPLEVSRTVTAVLMADGATSRFGQPVAMVARCKSGKTEVYINWQDYLGSEVAVTWRIGSAPARSKNWSLSSDSKATFYPDNDVDCLLSLIDVGRPVT
jgi:hypothetical protein